MLLFVMYSCSTNGMRTDYDESPGKTATIRGYKEKGTFNHMVKSKHELKVTVINGSYVKDSKWKKISPIEAGRNRVSISIDQIRSESINTLLFAFGACDIVFEAKEGVSYVAKAEFGFDTSKVWIEEYKTSKLVSEKHSLKMRNRTQQFKTNVLIK